MMSPSFFLILVLLIIVIVEAQRRELNYHPHHDQSDGPVEFDMYILATSWPAEYCHHESSNSCAMPEDYWKGHFTGHGLWPNNNDGTYPANCGGEAFNSSIPEEVIGFETMLTYWPNLNYDPGQDEYDEFWEHEWHKHGTCTGLQQEDYFKSAVAYFKQATPPLITDNAGKTVSISTLKDAWGGEEMVVFLCSGGKYLEAMYTCWTKSIDFLPEKQIACPTAVMKEGTCTSDTIIIPSFTTSPAAAAAAIQQHHHHQHHHRLR